MTNDILTKVSRKATDHFGDPNSYHGPDHDTWSAAMIAAALGEVANEIRLLRKAIEKDG